MEEEAGQGECFWGRAVSYQELACMCQEPGGSKAGSALKKTEKERREV